MEIMKKLLILIAMLVCSFACFAQSKMYVKNDGNSALSLRSEPKMFAKSKVKVAVGTEVNILETSADGKWVYVEVAVRKNQKGWTQKNLLSQRKPSTKSSASAKELALAGKGFNSEVEALYAQSGNGNFDSVDLIESFSVDEDSVFIFLSDGKLKGGQ